MPSPYAHALIPFVHSQLYSADNSECIQLYSGGVRVLNPNGDNPAVLPTSAQSKALLGLDEMASAFSVSVYGRGLTSTDGNEINELCQANRRWTMSFDNGETFIDFLVHGTIMPDPSMTSWKFVLVKSNVVSLGSPPSISTVGPASTSIELAADGVWTPTFTLTVSSVSAAQSVEPLPTVDAPPTIAFEGSAPGSGETIQNWQPTFDVRIE